MSVASLLSPFSLADFSHILENIIKFKLIKWVFIRKGNEWVNKIMMLCTYV